MRTELFDYELPEALIAQRPPGERDAGRMLELGPDGVTHRMVRELPSRLEPGDLLVLNETRVRRARVVATRASRDENRSLASDLGRLGGRVELLLLRLLGEDAAGVQRWEALGRANRPLRVGDRLVGPLGIELWVGARAEGGVVELRARGDLDAVLASHGQMPIPPYIERPSDEDDAVRYQTVFARELGSAAAPTAGLHLTEQMLGVIEARGVSTARVVLHVGVGTFRPVRADDLDEHPMHAEWISVSPELASRIAETRRRGGRVVAVGTTVVRALESARDPGRPGLVIPQSGETRLLIQPGYRFGVVDALLTNFHMPRSTLLALVSAFAGRARVLAAYREAVDQGYRFLSYGDAMWLPSRGEA